MKNGFDIVTDVRTLINVDIVNSLITGKIYPFVRPAGRDRLIDIVIGLLNSDNEQTQEADVNIRLHAPSIKVVINESEQYVPDYATFTSLTDILTSLLDEQYRETFFTEVDIPGDIIQDTDGTFFCLIRVTYRSIQDN